MFNDKINALKKTFFLLSLNINFVNIVKAEYLALLIINKIITKIIVIKTINKLKKDKILKFNKILNKFLLIIINLFIGIFIYLFLIYLDVNYYPRKFKKAKTIILKKPLKPDYLKIKVYRFIALLYILSKILKIVIIKILSHYIEEYGLFLN